MVNRKVSQASSRPATASPRKAASKRPTQAAPPAKAATQRPTAETPSRLAGLQRVYRETVAELRKVQWPDRTTTRNLTLVVIAMSTALAVILGLVDAVLTRVIEWLVQL
jgi:preprotein translocase subunit SecE